MPPNSPTGLEDMARRIAIACFTDPGTPGVLSFLRACNWHPVADEDGDWSDGERCASRLEALTTALAAYRERAFEWPAFTRDISA